MVDRASTFANPELLTSLRDRCIPVALDQAYQRRQQDAEGEFYRRIAGQGPRSDFRSTTQGFYLATAAGELLLYNNNRDPEKVARLVGEALQRFDDRAPVREAASPLDNTEPDARWHPTPPEGGLVLRVHSKVLGGYPPTTDERRRILQTALGRDNLWLTATEHRELVDGGLPRSSLLRIACFHLVDDTRGEPPMWRPEQIQVLDVSRDGDRISGTVRLRTQDGQRDYVASIFGFVGVDRDRVTRLDLVADGLFRGEGPFTPGAPRGWFPLAVAFTLADGSDVADAIPPQGSRGWVDGYLQPGTR